MLYTLLGEFSRVIRTWSACLAAVRASHVKPADQTSRLINFAHSRSCTIVSLRLFSESDSLGLPFFLKLKSVY